MSAHLGRALRSAYAQYGRVIKLDTPAGVDRLVPLWVKGEARLGRDYEFVIEAAALRDNDEIDPRKLLGNAVTLWVQQTDGSYLPIHGYVHGFSELGRDGACIYYQLRFSSWLYFLRLRRDQRDWKEVSGEQVLCDVFGEHRQATSNAFRFELTQPMPRYSYRMQSEFDLHFVYRSMEEAGVFGRFEFAADGHAHTFVIMDDVFNVPPLPSGTVRLGRAGSSEEFDGFQSWRERVQLQSARLETCSFDYKRPDLQKRAQANTAAPGSPPVDGTVYEYTGAYAWGSSDDGQRQACTRVEAWESQVQRFDALGSLRGAMPGLRYTLDRGIKADPSSPSEREYIILSVDWAVRNNVPGLDAYPAFEDSLRGELEARAAGQASAVVSHADGSEGFFLVRVESQRRAAPFRRRASCLARPRGCRHRWRNDESRRVTSGRRRAPGCRGGYGCRSQKGRRYRWRAGRFDLARSRRLISIFVAVLGRRHSRSVTRRLLGRRRTADMVGKMCVRQVSALTLLVSWKTTGTIRKSVEGDRPSI